MTFTNLTLGLLAVLVMNCQNNTESENSQNDRIADDISMKNNEFMYWINSYKVNCTGVGDQLCLLVQKGEEPKPGHWENFYSAIDGFDWEPGFKYQLIVKETHLPADQVPADGSSIKYSFVKELKKESDQVIRLHDIWALESIDGKEWSSKTRERPNMEINLTQGKVMGTDGCNRYQGDIKSVDQKNINLSRLASTEKACPDMDLSDLFNKRLTQVQSYKLNQLKLTLLDGSGNTLMQFRKVD